MIALTIIGAASIINAAPPLEIKNPYGNIILERSEKKDGEYLLHGRDLATSRYAFCVEHGFALTFLSQMTYQNRATFEIKDGVWKHLERSISGK